MDEFQAPVEFPQNDVRFCSFVNQMVFLDSAHVDTSSRHLPGAISKLQVLCQGDLKDV